VKNRARPQRATFWKHLNAFPPPLFSSSEDKIELLWCARGLALSRLQVLMSSPPALNSHTKVLCVLLLSWVQSCTSVVGNAVGIAVGAAVGSLQRHGLLLDGEAMY
jgi:hypothetical protein